MAAMTDLQKKIEKVVKDISGSTEKRAALYSSNSDKKSHIDNPAVYNLNKVLGFVSTIEDARKK